MIIFTSGTNTKLNACVGDNGGPYTFYHYAYGYYESAKQLAESIFKDNYHLDTKIYPILYLYRQYIELMLKHLIVTSSYIYKQKVKKIAGHDIYKKWNELILFLDENTELISYVNKKDEIDIFLKEISSIDNNGETFRYPFNLDGKVRLKSINLINVEIVYEKMGIIYSYFQMVDNEIDMIQEMKYDLRDY